MSARCLEGFNGVGTGILQLAAESQTDSYALFSITPFKYGWSIIARLPAYGKKNEHTICRPDVQQKETAIHLIFISC